MIRRLTVATAIVLFVSLPSAARAADQQLTDQIRTGATVSIVDEAGTVRQGRVESVSDQTIRLKKKRGAIDEIAAEDIVRVEKPDGLRNGALIGLAVGAGLGMAGGFSDGQGRGRRGSFVPVAILGNLVICTALGTALDAIFNHRRTLYERGGRRTETNVTPVMGSRAGGAVLHVSW
jgi:hypothetical protein